MRKWVWISGLALLLGFVGCKSEQPKNVQVEPNISKEQMPPSVMVAIDPDGPQSASHWRYRATYKKDGKTARFGIEFLIANSEKDVVVVRTGTGSFISDSRSVNSALLSDLKDALLATALPAENIRVRELPFKFVMLGENLDHGKDGGLIDAATGKWVGAKLFLGSQEHESQVFFNFEKPGGHAEFSLKDEEYGNAALQELAKVL